MSIHSDITQTRFAVGCMTGTSLDGIDAALIKITGCNLQMQAQYLGHVSQSFDDQLRSNLLALSKNKPANPIDFMQAARALGQFHADTLASLVHQYLPNHEPLAFAVAHGQTIWHAPAIPPAAKSDSKTESAPSLSWQLFDPWPIVYQLKIPVCYDLRQADLIAGGQGAPITPLADRILYKEHADTIINLGGVCNITSWDRDGVNENTSGSANLNVNLHTTQGGDIYPCNLINDGLTQRLFPPDRYDHNAQHAQQNLSNENTLNPCIDMLTEKINAPITHCHSLGREQLSDTWFDQLINDFTAAFGSQFGASINNALLAAANHAIANQIVARCETYRPSKIILAGGGAKNPLLVDFLTRNWLTSGAESVELSDAVGIPCEAREAADFAILGALSQDRVPITLSQITHANKPGCAGAWVYP